VRGCRCVWVPYCGSLPALIAPPPAPRAKASKVSHTHAHTHTHTHAHTRTPRMRRRAKAAKVSPRCKDPLEAAGEAAAEEGSMAQPMREARTCCSSPTMRLRFSSRSLRPPTLTLILTPSPDSYPYPDHNPARTCCSSSAMRLRFSSKLLPPLTLTLNLTP